MKFPDVFPNQTVKLPSEIPLILKMKKKEKQKDRTQEESARRAGVAETKRQPEEELPETVLSAEELLGKPTQDGDAAQNERFAEEELVLEAEELLSKNDKGAVEAQEKDDLSGNTNQGLIEELKQKASDNFDKYLRAVAELDNYQKRTIRERSDLIRYAGEGLARDIIEVLDNIERALSHKGTESAEEIFKGLELIHAQFVEVLNRHSVRGEEAKGQSFDPQKQQAMTIVPTSEVAAGTVIEEFKKAYFFKDKLLRPAQVVVASAEENREKEPLGPVSPEPQADTEEGEG